VQHDTEASLQFVPQIHPPPAHHPMTARIGAGLNQSDQFSLLLRCEFWFRTQGSSNRASRPSRRRCSDAPSPAKSGDPCRRSRPPTCDPTRRAPWKSQHPPGRRAVLLPPGRRSEFGRRQINPGNANRPTHRSCSTLVNRHRVRVSPIWESQNESEATAVGMSSQFYSEWRARRDSNSCPPDS
jgi:hypothetical protein